MSAFGEIEQLRPALAVREAARRGTLSHALLISGSGDRLALARYAAAAMECGSAGERPCGVCAACRKVLMDIHPDVITALDPDHKNLSVDVVRSVRSDAYVIPNEGERKVYIFPDCSILTPQDQNVLLKVVEEGPPYAAFLFCAENTAVVLETLRSRCVELKLDAPEDPDAALSEAGAALMEAVLSGRRGAVTEAAVRLEKQRISRDVLAEALDGCREIFAAALRVLYGAEPADEAGELAAGAAKNLTKTQIMRTIDMLRTYREACAFNAGVNLVLGALAVELEGILWQK